MGVLLIIVIIAGFVFFKIYTSPKEKKARELSRGKNEEQIKTIRYFLQTTFGPKWASRQEYESYLTSKVSINSEEAIRKLGVDESEVNEIDPVPLEGYVFNKNVLSKKEGNAWISSGYHVTWLFFSKSQVYIYKRVIYTDENYDNVSTLEYFYKDVTAFRTGTETYDVIDTLTGSSNSVNVDSFQVVVPGDDLRISVNNDGDFERKVQGMKQLLREKKNA